MAKQRKEDPPAVGSPAWMATFGDLMNLLLCFYVLLFSMSTVDAEKFKAMAESFSQTFSIFDNGATSIGDGLLVSNGVSQLNELDEYINSTGKTADSDDSSDNYEEGDDDHGGINDGDQGGVNSGQNNDEGKDDDKEDAGELKDKLEAAQLGESEKLAEQISEGLLESSMDGQVEVTFTSQYVQLTLKGALLFDSGKAEIRKEAVPVVDRIGIILERYSNNVIEIEGHTDNVPMNSNKYANNSELSCGRALAVYEYLIDHTGIEPRMIKYSGRGEYVPVADNSTPEGRAKNRRVEIRIYNDLSTYQ